MTKLSVQSRAGALALALAAVAVGGVFLLFGIALLVALGAAALALLVGTILYRKLTGNSNRARRLFDAGRGLDPALEVFSRHSSEQWQRGMPPMIEQLPRPKTADDRGPE